jgi:uncharacterized protein (DUF2062 family)
MNLRRWLKEHSLKLLAIRDQPGAVAGGVAIGIFFGFTPLVGLKTASSIFFAWVTRSNLIAAAVACTLHDLFLPFMPLIYRFEYRVGYWLLSQPHHWPVALRKLDWSGYSWRTWNWHAFFTLGRPLLLGSIVLAVPSALLAFAITKVALEKQRRKHAPVQHFPAGPPPAPG